MVVQHCLGKFYSIPVSKKKENSFVCPEVLHDCTSLLYIIRKIINVKEKLGVLFSCNFLTTTFKNSLEKSY